MTDLFQEPDDATPLDPDERAGLLQDWIATRAELNAAEQDNIDTAAAWVFRRRRAPILSVEFTNDLHRRMFNDVWAWAGTYRATERNVGVAPYMIGVQMAQLFDDANYWVDHETYPADEIAVRLHHRLVAIHPYPNGNGRLSRMMADLLIQRLGQPAFSWGSEVLGGQIADMGELRRQYIAALRAADRHDITALMEFARS
ncbi:mobile mystery protein B [Hyphomonas oceanitis]|uniref:Cell filamentation protein n=1 Tax=Hyphomonas oceanitis SCH89 TaxID=1280953 RepID=A0A059G494_9PROT|nr:mobile mystery protein B [Hyphomonas oceanitis]KDA01298.1 cell filamentation protein [Hyphomonas oceanitis SCH89]